MTFPFDVGDTVLCVSDRSAHIGSIGIVADIDLGDYSYTIRSLTRASSFIGSPLSWTKPDSWKKIPSNTRPMTKDDIKAGIKVVCVRVTGIVKGLSGTVGVIDRTGANTWYVKTPDGKYLGGGYWINLNDFRVVLDDEAPQTLNSRSNVVGDIVVDSVTVGSPTPSQSNPCPRKYSGLDECTCGTCPPKKRNPFFFKMQ